MNETAIFCDEINKSSEIFLIMTGSESKYLSELIVLKYSLRLFWMICKDLDIMIIVLNLI
jgi:hypothetical protein